MPRASYRNHREFERSVTECPARKPLAQEVLELADYAHKMVVEAKHANKPRMLERWSFREAAYLEVLDLIQMRDSGIAKRLVFVLRQAYDGALIAHKGKVPLSQIRWIKELQEIKAELEFQITWTKRQ